MRKILTLLLLLLVSFSIGFSQEVSYFAQIDPDKYTLGPGDKLRVYLIKEKDSSEIFDLEVSPTGSISLPMVGNIKVSGLTLSNALKEITRQLIRFYPKSIVSLDLVFPRNIKVFITGEVVNPGTYILSALSRLDDLIKSAGGLKNSASTRGIQIKRGDKVIEVDYLKFLKEGDLSENPFIEEGDLVYVPLMKKSVRVLGQVKNPGIYEIKEGERLLDVLNMAGGLTEKASLFGGTLDRVDGTRIELDLYGLFYGKEEEKDKANLYLQDGDALTIPSEVKRVYVLGYVKNPGPVQLVEKVGTTQEGTFVSGQALEGARISEIINSAGGVLPNGSLRNIEIRRKGNPENKIIVDLYKILVLGEMGEEEIKIYPGDVIYVPPLTRIVKVLGQVRFPGIYEMNPGDRIRDIILRAGGITEKAGRENGQLERVVNDKKVIYIFNITDAIQGKEKDNLLLEDGDTVYVPETRRLVYVLGQVNNPGAFEYKEGRRLTEYISLAGGVKDRANLSKVSIIREENGESKIIPVNLSDIVNKGQSKLDIEIKENDIIFVPEVFIKGWQDIVQILMGIGVLKTTIGPLLGW
ncbi:MAG: SLBB domain-containing protein [Dictyoglomaceae bacterium]